MQPDDEDEHEAATAQRREQAGDIAGSEGLDLEQRQMEHRLSDQGLDHTESDEHGDTPAELGDDDRVRPAHGVVAVGLDPVGDPDEQ